MENVQHRSIAIPSYKLKYIKQDWLKIYTPIVEICKLQVKMNVRTKNIEVRTCEYTVDAAYVERSIEFIRAILHGFTIEDSMAILKFADVFIDSFGVNEVKTLRNAHFDRAIGRIVGREGKTKGAIEHFAKCRLVIRDGKVFFLGEVENVRIAKDAVSRLIMGSKPGSIFNRLRIISTRIKDRSGTVQTVYNELEKRT